MTMSRYLVVACGGDAGPHQWSREFDVHADTFAQAYEKAKEAMKDEPSEWDFACIEEQGFGLR